MKSKLFSIFLVLVLILLISVSARLFLLEIFLVPSDSMKDTIIPGDKVLIFKMTYGSRLPSSPSEIPWINLLFYISKNYRENADSIRWKYRRLNGFTDIKHNDIIVFDSNNSDDVLIKRCMGLPGDTLQIRNEQVYANGKKIPEIATVRLLSRIFFHNRAMASSFIDSLEIEANHYINDFQNHITVPLNINQVNVLMKNKSIDSICIEKKRRDTSFSTFPWDTTLFNWTLDDFGPVMIPSKGMTIQLNRQNYALYHFVINQFEGSEIKENNDRYYINGIIAATYTFIQDYYFMLGDNRHSSSDSRYRGFIPEQNIIGKAVVILFSNGNDGFRWNRLFRKIE